jgi:hypothetical protein
VSKDKITLTLKKKSLLPGKNELGSKNINVFKNKSKTDNYIFEHNNFLEKTQTIDFGSGKPKLEVKYEYLQLKNVNKNYEHIEGAYEDESDDEMGEL